MKQLHEEGCKEVLLLGQNVNSYADLSGSERASSGNEASTSYYAEVGTCSQYPCCTPFSGFLMDMLSLLMIAIKESAEVEELED